MPAVLVIATAIFAASFVQASAGFGSALLSMPLMSLVVGVPEAVAVSLLVDVVVNLLTIYHHHDAIAWTEARRLSIGAVLAMPVGALLLMTIPIALTHVVLGAVTVAAVVVLLVRRRSKACAPLPARRVPAYTAGVLSLCSPRCSLPTGHHWWCT